MDFDIHPFLCYYCISAGQQNIVSKSDGRGHSFTVDEESPSSIEQGAG